MKPESKNHLLARFLLCVLMAVALKGRAQDSLPQNYQASLDHPWLLEKMDPDDDWTRHFRVGALVGLNIKGNFSMSGSFNVSHKAGIYDDGYVLTDSSGNSGGLTTYWGYNDSSQYDSGAQTLTMHSAKAFSLTSGSTGSGNAGPSP